MAPGTVLTVARQAVVRVVEDEAPEPIDGPDDAPKTED